MGLSKAHVSDHKARFSALKGRMCTETMFFREERGLPEAPHLWKGDSVDAEACTSNTVLTLSRCNGGHRKSLAVICVCCEVQADSVITLFTCKCTTWPRLKTHSSPCAGKVQGHTQESCHCLLQCCWLEMRFWLILAKSYIFSHVQVQFVTPLSLCWK